MSLNKNDVLLAIENIALNLGVPPDKSTLAAGEMFKSMVRASVAINNEHDRDLKKAKIETPKRLEPESEFLKYLSERSPEVRNMTLMNNVRPYVPLYQHFEFEEPKMEMQKTTMPMPAYEPDAEIQAQTQALREITTVLNKSFSPVSELSSVEDARRQSAKEARKALDASKLARMTQFMDNHEAEGDISLALEKNKSLSSAFGIGTQRNSCAAVDPDLDKSYTGKVLGVTEYHMVLSLGRSALVVGKADIDRVPAVGEDVDLKFSGGKGVFAPVKAVGVER